jgi:UDP-N-acetylmuramyl pentapeptide phosphotransferase/UDP-N-acetylglucosamine-1-phosphate transferase
LEKDSSDIKPEQPATASATPTSGETGSLYHREEVRGVFVLGTIAAFLSAYTFLPKEVPFIAGVLGVKTILEVLVSYWGIYAVLTAIGVSDDVMPTSRSWKALCHFTLRLGRMMFVFGILFAAAFLIWSMSVSILAQPPLALLFFIGFIVLAVTSSWLVRSAISQLRRLWNRVSPKV